MTFFTKYLAAFMFMVALVNHQPLYADKESSGWGAAIGAFIGAMLGIGIEEALNDPSSPCIPVDKKVIKNNVIYKIDNLCKTDQQLLIDREKISLLKITIIDKLSGKIDATCYTSQTQANQDFDNHIKDEMALYISKLAWQYAREEALLWYKRPPVNPIYVNKLDVNTFASDTAQQIALEVKQQYDRNYPGSLQHYWGDALKRKIEIIAEHKFQRKTPLECHNAIDYAKIEYDMMQRIDRLCATSEQTVAKQQIIANIKQKVREQLMYDIRHKQYTSQQEAQADAIGKLNSFLPEILQDYAVYPQKAYVKQRTIEALERNAANGLKYLISDELH